MPKGVKPTAKSLANLRTPTHDEAVAMVKIANENRRLKKEKRLAMQATLDILLERAMKSGKLTRTEDIENIAEAEGINVSAQDAMLIALVQRACAGDVQAFTAIRDTVGEKPSDKVKIDQTTTIETWAKNHKVKL